MKKLHQKETKGSRFLIEPAEELDNIVGVAAILAPYYGLTLKHARDTKWKGREAPIKRFATGLCQGLQHMHENGVAHRDIKADNILLQNVEGDPMIIDFGLSNANELSTGTRKYLAPEQIKGKKGALKGAEWWVVAGWDQRLFDSWALGCVIKRCFEGHDTPQTAQDFIAKLLREDAEMRMSIKEALKHPWLQTKKTTEDDLFK